MSVSNLISKFRELKESIRRKWILYRTGYQNWEIYSRMTDSDINWRATRIKDFYHGYPFVHRFADHKHEIYSWNIYANGIYIINDWCQTNIKGKYRFDCHRSICYPSTGNEWEINEIGGGDYFYAAFKNESDLTWFLMKWG